MNYQSLLLLSDPNGWVSGTFVSLWDAQPTPPFWWVWLGHGSFRAKVLQVMHADRRLGKQSLEFAFMRLLLVETCRR
jgi:hypothetical protein